MAVERPEITKIAPGTYLMLFASAGVSVKAERIREKSDDIFAFLTFKLLPSEHLKSTKLNLGASTSQSSLAKVLEQRAPAIDWFAVVENTCRAIEEIFRTGEPLVTLRDIPFNEEVQWLLKPLIVKGEANVIYGPGDSGKSLIGVLAALLVEHAPQRYDIPPLEASSGRVAILDWETNEATMASRLVRMARGMGIDPPATGYAYMSRSMWSDQERVANLVFKNELDLVIIDSMGPAIDDDANAAGPVNQLFNALREMQVTSLLIDHVSKDSGKQYGSIYKYNRSRNTWRARASEESRVEGIVTTALYHEKFNDGQRASTPLGLSFAFDGGSIIPQAFDATSDPEFSPHIKARVRLRELIKSQGAMSSKDMADKLDMKLDTVRKTLQRNAQFVDIGQDTWGIRADKEAEAMLEEMALADSSPNDDLLF